MKDEDLVEVVELWSGKYSGRFFVPEKLVEIRANGKVLKLYANYAEETSYMTREEVEQKFGKTLNV